ncbi:GNAT family N-acetyltransferase [Vibrio splendidus]|uniref:GNAT family N-acetyltransferase n=1 Tax=Vibrio TaxID=662 RepID=UPI00076ADC99|nr:MULTISPECIES: GNAT family N-acetyltransferase [Vibrio]MCY9862292.1 GNAT family N-acetyltransferase [Vibrio coralliirubri]HAS27359.1 N-acetyltransferase [Vibrio sp.]MBB1463629.1 GNAT family N-acetyltransferase [Vibrio sp. SG41-7]MCC4787652.1 GNAT family N-acetyltransferase [Vibrio splendidus]PHX05012.1 Acetyltransferase YpeA [Vibrio splendidus]
MVNIREMAISDYDSVIALWCQTEGMSIRGADSKESIASYLDRNPGLSFVAESNNEIIGAVLVGTDGRRGYLQHLAVSANFRGQKLGCKLVAEAVNALAGLGIPKTHLFVYNDNINAQQFYEKLGWFPRDEVRMYSFNSSDNSNV